MTWLIKFKDGRYVDGDGNRRGRAFAHEYAARHQAYEELANSWSRHEAEPRIVRLKPRAKLDEAAIRRAERGRIAAAVDEQGILITIAHRPVGQIAYLDNCTNGARGAQALKSAILAFDWKPGAP